MFWQRVAGCSEADDNVPGERVAEIWGVLDNIWRVFVRNLMNIFMRTFSYLSVKPRFMHACSK